MEERREERRGGEKTRGKRQIDIQDVQEQEGSESICYVMV